MCRALKILCAATSAEGLAELKRAAVSAQWELVGGALSIEQLGEQLDRYNPDVVVADAGLGPGTVDAVRAARLPVRLVAVGSLPGADEAAESTDEVRDAILGAPRPGGPVRG
jgi:Mrp family chromosome partitioning ATPase